MTIPPPHPDESGAGRQAKMLHLQKFFCRPFSRIFCEFLPLKKHLWCECTIRQRRDLEKCSRSAGEQSGGVAARFRVTSQQV